MIFVQHIKFPSVAGIWFPKLGMERRVQVQHEKLPVPVCPQSDNDKLFMHPSFWIKSHVSGE